MRGCILDELVIYHYGVKGMRWGIRRTPEQLGRKIESLTAKNKKIQEKRVDRANIKSAKYAEKASKFRYKATKKKAFATSTSDLEKAQKFEFKAAKLEIKSNKFKAMAAKGQAKINKNKELISVFEKTIDAIDDGTIKRGESFVENFFMQYKT